MVLSGCSTSPSIKLIKPVVDLPTLEPAIPATLLKGCDKLLTYDSNDTRDVIKTTIKNHNLYFICNSKLKSAISLLRS